MTPTPTILDTLNAPVPLHRHIALFSQFPRVNIAKNLGISASHLANILSGYTMAGTQLTKRIDELAREIQEALAQAE